uniref:Uncharacterized protein n=1 Tax=Glossina pallidipes TaxID=7398 RepID=A0A1A9ZLA9_GLOPL
MDLEKIFCALESNQNYEYEEAKRKLIEVFTQSREQWLVHYMMEYYLKTGSARIIEVLVKVQTPHDGYIFDRLTEWLKAASHRIKALNLFCFVVRKHPTWLFKVEKHRLIKDMLHWLKQLEIEKEIVPLMSALLAIITLLPIIPNLVPNFLNDLFGVFAHLASWNSQNTNRLSEDKLVHLQLGLQMLFHRLYGMFPCNFMSYLTEFTKREKGAIFQHTIKPLLETVRLHPMLITATPESEVNSERWKEIQPHDVVVECMRLSLPFKYHDISTTKPETSSCCAITNKAAILNSANSYHQTLTHHQFRESQQQRLPAGGSSAALWSPYHEILNSSHTPLTPTPTPYIMPLPSSASTAANQTNLSVSGCSPPEAAVEATPETTPLKDNRDIKRSSIGNASGTTNPLAVRAIFVTSQPSSPLRTKDSSHQQQFFQQRFNFPDVVQSNITTYVEQELNTRIITRVTSNDRRMQQIMQDRNQSQSPFQTIEAQAAKMGFGTPPEVCQTPEVDVVSSNRFYQPFFTPLSDLTSTSTPTPTPTPNTTPSLLFPEVKVPICDDCNETDQSLCTKGGLQMPTSRSMQLLAKGIKRRNRMTSYCYNEKSNEKVGTNGTNDCSGFTYKVRRTKSCSSLYLHPSNSWCSDDDSDLDEDQTIGRRPLQKSHKMMAIASAFKTVATNLKKEISLAKKPLMDKYTQTLEAVPVANHENSLLQMLIESKDYRSAFEASRQTPNEILEQFIARGLRNNSGDRSDQEQFQLLCLQLQYERYRREIHAERNRRLLGRSRDKRSLEMERDRLREQLKDFEAKNLELSLQLDKTKKITNEREREYQDELEALKVNYQNELEKNRCLRQANDNLQARLSEELTQRKDVNYELEALRGQVFSLTTELQHAQQQAEMGLRCKQDLARLEAEMIIMGEVQIKCRDRLAEMDNLRVRDKELQSLQEAYNVEFKELKHTLDDKSSQLDSARHRLQELQTQLVNNEKVITEQKRLLKAVKDEYEEKFKALNKKYEIQKIIVMQIEEKFVMSLNKPTMFANVNASCSPDTDKTDVASSVERNSPLSTSLASSESLSTSLRSSELRNLQQLVETPISEMTATSTSTTTTNCSTSISVLGVSTGVNITDGERVPALDLASSANTVSNIMNTLRDSSQLNSPEISAISSSCVDRTTSTSLAANVTSLTATTSTLTHIHPHLHLQKQQTETTQQRR